MDTDAQLFAGLGHRFILFVQRSFFYKNAQNGNRKKICKRRNRSTYAGAGKLFCIAGRQIAEHGYERIQLAHTLKPHIR